MGAKLNATAGGAMGAGATSDTAAMMAAMTEEQGQLAVQNAQSSLAMAKNNATMSAAQGLAQSITSAMSALKDLAKNQ